ncbi:MAG TPA: YebC/PmpR family DNA-binding transcriptional regulator [Dehalococcoidia bacterium]|nr:YebC/PmpR family DNA-binding transcriptional regulator [Dehalococcoidia bacterium]
MAGHSKWKQIKRQKGVADARRGALFTKLGREITMAVRQGGGPEPDTNPRLRLAVQKARENNMPNEIIERAIAKAVGPSDASQLEEVVYEGYAPGGAAVLVEAMTDNRNRTVGEVRNVFNRAGGNLGETGSVAWVFQTRGVITVNLGGGTDADEVALMAVDAGAEDFEVEEDVLSIYTKPEELESVRRALEEGGVAVASSEIARVPSTTVRLEEKDAISTLRLLERLEELDDVQKVYSNADFPDNVLAGFTA